MLYLSLLSILLLQNHFQLIRSFALNWGIDKPAVPAGLETNMMEVKLPGEGISYMPLDRRVDNSCANAAGSSGNAVWNVSDGEAALDQFVDMWTNNLLYYKECFGLSKDACKDPATGCELGLRDFSATRSHDSQPRLDIALGKWANFSTSMTCGAGGQGCTDVTCPDVGDSAAAYLMIQQLVLLSNYLQKSFTTLQSASTYALGYSNKFSTTFFPVDPAASTGRTVLAVLGSFVSGLIGFMPQTRIFGFLLDGKVAKDLGASVAAAGANAVYSNNMPTPVNLNSLVVDMGYSVTNATEALSNALFVNGSYGEVNGGPTNGGAGISLVELMRDGKLLNMTNVPNLDGSVFPNYVKTIYQHVTWYVWQQDEEQTPYIAFAPGKCSELNYKDEKSVPFANVGLEYLDNSLDYKGNCYWLLNVGLTIHGAADPDTTYWTCDHVKALNKGTNKQFSDLDNEGLSLADFIIPSVEGWLANNKLNGYSMSYGEGASFIGDPQAAGAINITVCDYMDVRDIPGLGCPTVTTGEGNSGDHCDVESGWTHPKNSLIRPNTGYWTPGQCKIQLTQYLKYLQFGDMDENPDYWQYQLSVDILDHQNRVIGNAAKAWVGAIWQVWNSMLPFDLWVRVPDPQDDAIELWYSDQHWDTNDHSDQFHCFSGAWSDGNRKLNCTFACPNYIAGDPIPASATVANPFPAGAITQAVIPFGDQAAYTFSSTKPSPTANIQLSPTDYDPSGYQGKCSVHVTQYELNWDSTDNDMYQMEAYLNLYNGPPFSEGANAQVVVPYGKANNIYGMRTFFSVYFQQDAKEPMQFEYHRANGDQDHWNSQDKDGTSAMRQAGALAIETSIAVSNAIEA